VTGLGDALLVAAGDDGVAHLQLHSVVLLFVRMK
jgi:hypothetical protein